ncbi:MAG: transposase [Clostridia bacterium]|nr:transposase [Clostridia bacterium]
MSKVIQNDGRCVLTLPLLVEPYQEHILEKRFRILEHLHNSFAAYELRKLKNLQRTKAYRNLMQQIADTPKEKRAPLYKQRSKMLRDAGFSEFAFKDDITPMQKHFAAHIATHVAHREASDIWRSFEKYLYHGAKKIHFKRRGTLVSAANQKVGNAMNYKNGIFIWNGGQSKDKITLQIRVQRPDTAYEAEMLQKEAKYFRIIRKWVKSRFKYYLQITLVGNPVKKPRIVNSGKVGLDIGTQSIAIASENAVHLLELADRVNDNHKKILSLQRKMDTSRRLTNPGNYNPDGTIRRGIRLSWVKSKRYQKLAGQVRELQRKNADIRKYQHTCLANYILSLGTQVYVEPMDYRALQRRAKKTTKNAQGRYNRKKRFGKSLANKAPSMFLTILESKLAQYGGSLQRVSKWEFKASQYDHLSQTYSKKKLSQRSFVLSNGDSLQRDLYSAFLIMNADSALNHPDSEACTVLYPSFKSLHDQEILRIQNLISRRLGSFGIA